MGLHVLSRGLWPLRPDNSLKPPTFEKSGGAGIRKVPECWVSGCPVLLQARRGQG